MEQEVQLGQVRPSPPRVGAKVEALSPEDNLVPFPAQQAIPARYLPPPPATQVLLCCSGRSATVGGIGRGTASPQLLRRRPYVPLSLLSLLLFIIIMKTCTYEENCCTLLTRASLYSAVNGEKSSLVVKARDVRRQGGKIVRGRPTAHAAPPVSAPQTSGGSTTKAAPVALRLPPMGVGGLPGKGRGSAITSPPAGRPSPNPSPVAFAHLPPGSNRPPSHGTHSSTAPVMTSAGVDRSHHCAHPPGARQPSPLICR
jgi:hypothetical protein